MDGDYSFVFIILMILGLLLLVKKLPAIIGNILTFLFSVILLILFMVGALFGFPKKKKVYKPDELFEVTQGCFIPLNLIRNYHGEEIDFDRSGVIVMLDEPVEFIYNSCTIYDDDFTFVSKLMWEEFCQQHPNVLKKQEKISVFDYKDKVS